MNSKEYAFLSADVQELRRILHKIPHEKVITRKSYEYRLAQAEESLRQMQATPMPETMIITFKGKPVRGMHGIFADFATKATGRFSDAFAAFVAIAKGKTLGGSGALPEFDKHRLLIIGTALGSFGFELELPIAEPESAPMQVSLLPEENPIIKARDMLEKVLVQSLEGDDDQLAESIEGIDQRAIDNVQAFYEVLRQDEAGFSLTIGPRQITCPGVEKAQHAGARLKSDYIVTDNVCFTGCPGGAQPSRREFDFKPDNQNLIRVKIDKSIDDIDRLNLEWLHKPVSIQLDSRTVGQGRPRYTLMSLDHITPTDTEASHG